jgi:predicted DNA-binding mobile mystery protein A
MKSAIQHLDERFAALRPFANTPRPPKGWLRAVRDALGMTTAQFARRLGIAQPSAVELEKAEAAKKITLHTLERAAEALGCRVVYVLIPERPLVETVSDRARLVAERKLAAVEQSMQLEDQAVGANKIRENALRGLMDDLIKKPARLWDDL